MVIKDFISQDDVNDRNIDYLFYFLMKNEQFMHMFQILKDEYAMFVNQYSWKSVIELSRSKNPSLDIKKDCDLAEQYHNGVISLIEKFGLNSAWAGERIHNGIRNMDMLRVGRSDAGMLQIKGYIITWNNISESTKTAIKKKVLKEFESQWSDYQRYLSQRGFVKRIIRNKTESVPVKHMEWVYAKICLGKTWLQLSNEQNEDEKNIRNIVRPICKHLNLIIRRPKRKA
jgi:hypothetical protein